MTFFSIIFTWYLSFIGGSAKSPSPDSPRLLIDEEVFIFFIKYSYERKKRYIQMKLNRRQERMSRCNKLYGTDIFKIFVSTGFAQKPNFEYQASIFYFTSIF
ncbi:hypothetical protein K501DRAFT_275273 [Backusella circina FSU 941]|nr:hypothetical protein K501DRAFT_275273 [Backusella circina FSU 941]